MDFDALETTAMMAQSARDFAHQHIAPHLREWDEKQHFPVDLFHALGQMGFMGMLVPESYEGAGLGYDAYTAIVEEIAEVDPSIGLSVAAHNSLCTNHLLCFGDEAQKRRWLPELATGRSLGAWALTEHNTGSDAAAMRATAVREGDEWVVNGSKNFITHGISGHLAIVLVRTGEKHTSHNVSAFVVEKGTPGFRSGKKQDKLGMRASETAELIFDNCRVPHENLLGQVGEGFTQALKVLDGGRISIAALSLGIAKGAYEAALKYACERQQFGKPISEFQGVSFKLAEMATEIQAAESLLQSAVHEKNRGRKVTTLSAMCKLYASEACVKIANEAVQIHGGYGYTKDFPVEKFYRDAKLCTIGEGTSEIQKLVIARNILK